MATKHTANNLRLQTNPEPSPDDSAFIIKYSDEFTLTESPISINIPLTALDATHCMEHWTGSFSRISTEDGMSQIYANDNFAFAAAPISLVNPSTLEHATHTVYNEIFEQIKTLGYPHLIRTWNFLPDIHIEHDQTDNYKLFCSGRTKAYSEHGKQKSVYPAATVVGSHHPGLYVYYIASKNPGIGIENSQQVSAFEYPSNYSMDPPLFSRALLQQTPQQDILFISGTASITGHETQHLGNIEKQLALCVSNIEHLLDTASDDHRFARTSFSACEQIKVYLKNTEHLAIVKLLLQDYIQQGANIHYFQGDMCRDDLLVEIEALAMHEKN